jgi:hypothetical protein
VPLSALAYPVESTVNIYRLWIPELAFISIYKPENC